MSENIIFTQEKQIGLVTLNRPEALNALTLDMIIAFYQQLSDWEHDETIKAVVICAAKNSKAFCAGGDVRWLYEMGCAKNPTQMDFFINEYKLNQYIDEYPKPFIALMDGITMGGGVGISLHGRYAIASENFVFAMPETSIGFFPDIGASFLLANCPDNFGVYLGLTGNRLNARDAFDLGLINYIIASKDLDSLLSMLLDVDLSFETDVRIEHSLSRFNAPEINSTIALIRNEVRNCFAGKSIESILKKLSLSNDEWHVKTKNNLLSKSPLSLKITLQQILFAKDRNLEDCLITDLHLARHFMQDQDFYEGVRALLIDKDKSPHWKPSSIEQVTNSMIDRYFG